VKADAAVAPSKKKAETSAAPTMNERIWREIVSWFWVILAFLFIEGTLVQARVIPSGSMEKTVLIGDHLIVSRMGYDAGIPFTNVHEALWRNPKRQQIMVFRAPLADQGYPDFIKRVIGLPGDHLKIVNGVVYVNGQRLVEPYTKHDPPDYADLALENFPARGFELPFNDRPEWAAELAKNTVNGELVVPPGRYFMMGDNRDNSLDSRVAATDGGVGFVPVENLVGRAEFVVGSYDFLNAHAIWSWLGEFRLSRFFNGVN